MSHRPRAGETEEDLLAFQESFLRSREAPSATLGVKRRPERDVVRLSGMYIGQNVCERKRESEGEREERIFAMSAQVIRQLKLLGPPLPRGQSSSNRSKREYQ